jgi:proline iminopeptidase
MIFPEAYADFVNAVPRDERRDMLAAYHRMINSPDPDVRASAALAWSNWEGAAVALVPDAQMMAQYAKPAFAVPFARIALHYFINRGWLDPDQLIRDAGKLAGIRGRIIQGRYDAVTPPATAWALHQAWPGSELLMLPRAGHAVTDQGVLDGLIKATDGYRD